MHNQDDRYRTVSQLHVSDLPAFVDSLHPLNGSYPHLAEDMHESMVVLPPPPPVSADRLPNLKTPPPIHLQSSQVAGVNPATTFSHLDPFMENSYSEIPTFPTGNEPAHIQDMKGLEYLGRNHHPQTSYNYHKAGGQALQNSPPQDHNRPHVGSREDNFTSLTVPRPPGSCSQQRIDDTLDLDYYSEVRKPCRCDKQVTIHVVIMALAGIAYISIGGLAGFYIGKKCKFS